MRRVTVIAASLALVGALAGSAAAAPNGHFVAASGWRLNLYDDPTVEFRASAQISSGHAIGTYQFGSTGLDLAGLVTCGDVDGAVAVLGGRVTSTTDPAYEGGYFLLWFVDGGATVFGRWGPDQVSTTDVGGGSSTVEFGTYPDLPEDFPASCPPATGLGFDQVVGAGLRTVVGSITVH